MPKIGGLARDLEGYLRSCNEERAHTGRPTLPLAAWVSVVRIPALVVLAIEDRDSCARLRARPAG